MKIKEIFETTHHLVAVFTFKGYNLRFPPPVAICSRPPVEPQCYWTRLVMLGLGVARDPCDPLAWGQVLLALWLWAMPQAMA